jgi:hypothetical protein
LNQRYTGEFAANISTNKRLQDSLLTVLLEKASSAYGLIWEERNSKRKRPMAILESSRKLQFFDIRLEKHLPGAEIFQRCRALIRKTVFLLSTVSILFLSYSAFWMVWYRIPTSPPQQIDLRQSQVEKPYYVSFCSSLAANPTGYPGHTFVVWTTTQPKDLTQAESYGFAPSHGDDQIPSLFKIVPGAVAPTDSRGNMRNLDRLTIVVNQNQFEKTIALRQNWRGDTFRAGVRDCVAFSRDIALSLGLKVPIACYMYPQDYLRELKKLNSGN